MTIAERMKSKRADTRAQAKREMQKIAQLREEMGGERVRASVPGQMLPNRETAGRFPTQDSVNVRRYWMDPP